MALRVVPWWLGWMLALPLRRLVHDPEKILRDHVREGMTVADLGCGPGFFTVAMAKLVGPTGRVFAVDLQQPMLKMAARGARRKGVEDRIVFHRCEERRLGLTEPVDFALAFAMVHEVPDAGRFLSEVAAIVKPGGRFLFAEPKRHVSGEDFDESVQLALKAGFKVHSEPEIKWCRAALFEKP